MFTEEILINSQEFKDWIKGEIELIHNIYWDSKEPYQTYIVLHSNDSGKTDITRFFMIGGNIQVSQDHRDLSRKEVYEKLLKQYSSGKK